MPDQLWQRSALLIPSFWIIQFWPWHRNLKASLISGGFLLVGILFTLGGVMLESQPNNAATCCIASTAPAGINWGDCTNKNSRIRREALIPDGVRQNCPVPVTAYIVGGIGWTSLILYATHCLYIMRSPPAIAFSPYFYFAPEFSLLFVHAFRNGHYYLAPISVVVATAYVITSLSVFIILHLSYAFYHCYAIDTPIDEIVSVCPHSTLTITEVFTLWINAWQAIVASLITLTILATLHRHLYLECTVRKKATTKTA